MAKSWHQKHISTKWGVVIIGFLLISLGLFVFALNQKQDVRSNAYVTTGAERGGEIECRKSDFECRYGKLCPNGKFCIFTGDSFRGKTISFKASDLRRGREGSCPSARDYGYTNSEGDYVTFDNKARSVINRTHATVDVYDDGECSSGYDFKGMKIGGYARISDIFVEYLSDKKYKFSDGHTSYKAISSFRIVN